MVHWYSGTLAQRHTHLEHDSYNVVSYMSLLANLQHHQCNTITHTLSHLLHSHLLGVSVVMGQQCGHMEHDLLVLKLRVNRVFSSLVPDCVQAPTIPGSEQPLLHYSILCVAIDSPLKALKGNLIPNQLQELFKCCSVFLVAKHFLFCGL